MSCALPTNSAEMLDLDRPILGAIDGHGQGTIGQGCTDLAKLIDLALNGTQK